MGLENVTGTVAAWLATEVLSVQFFESYKAKLRFFAKVHHDSNPVARTELKKYRVKSKPGTAPAGPGENVALQNTYQLSTGTTISATSTEFVADMMELSANMVADTLGLDLDMVADRMINGTQAEFEQMLAPFVGDMVYRALAAAETNVLALLAGLSTGVGTTDTNFSLAKMLACRYQFRINQAHRPLSECQYWLPELSQNDVEAEVLATSGGIGGAVWMTQAEYGTANNNPRWDTEGLLGMFLGHPVYTIPPDSQPTANSGEDYLGFFGVPGVPGVAPDAPELAGLPGAFTFYERQARRLDYRTAFAGRGGRIRSLWQGAFVESSDADGVQILADGDH